MKHILQKIINLTGYHISRLPTPAKDFRHNPFLIQKKLLGHLNQPPVIFDIGAFTGQVTKEYLHIFPDAQLYCFEPYPFSFLQLKKNTLNKPNIQIFNKAVGAIEGRTKFHDNQFSQTNSVLPSLQASDEIWGKGLQTTRNILKIEMVTLDHFMEMQQLSKIDILKLDVQGAEYNVLEGAANALKNGKITLIYLEIMTIACYEGQKRLDEIFALLHSFGYELFDFYNYSYTKEGRLRCVDAIFTRREPQP